MFISEDDIRLGLMCVIYNELQRIKTKGGHINIMETVKLMKKRNKEIICSPVSKREIRYVFRSLILHVCKYVALR